MFLQEIFQKYIRDDMYQKADSYNTCPTYAGYNYLFFYNFHINIIFKKNCFFYLKFVY